MALSPCMFFSRYWGPKWRARRRARLQEAEERARIAAEKARAMEVQAQVSEKTPVPDKISVSANTQITQETVEASA